MSDAPQQVATPRTEDQILTGANRLDEGSYVRADFARTLERELSETQAAIAELIVRDGNWLDKWGSCRVCGGEIPYGHTNNCDIYKQEKETIVLRAERDALVNAVKGYQQGSPTGLVAISETELVALREDKARLDWFNANLLVGGLMGNLRAAIDATRSSATPQKQEGA